MPLLVKSSRDAFNNVDDTVGRWQFEGGTVTQANRRFNAGSETGSISAASNGRSCHIGEQYTRTGATDLADIG